MIHALRFRMGLPTAAALLLAVTATAPASAQRGMDGPLSPPEAAEPAPKADRERGRDGSPGETAPEARNPAPDAKKQAKAKRPKFRLPGASIPADPVKRARLLRDLYAFLATAETPEAGKIIADAIERVWVTAAGDTIKVLFDRAEKASANKDNAFALKMLDAATKIAPDFPEAFNRRAFIHYQEKDVERALGDLRRAIALEPNHFKALDGLGQILREIGNKKAALEVYRHLNDVHPHWPGARSALDELNREVEGEAL